MEDAEAILAITVPQRNISDRVLWSRSSNGIYSAKDGYRFWYDENVRTVRIPTSRGWGKLWQLLIPHRNEDFHLALLSQQCPGP